ncbi:MAG: hypothetical protein COB04_19595 [Gammaproteobacteria bacterium]|nr:MAG: hypothetical protein COB04_19595 [Gammaproteobacteria bacterium]
MSKKAHELAMKKFEEGVQTCSSESEISEFCQMITTLATKTIHGIEGKKFKKDFLRGAINDNEMIKPHRAVEH